MKLSQLGFIIFFKFGCLIYNVAFFVYSGTDFLSLRARSGYATLHVRECHSPDMCPSRHGGDCGFGSHGKAEHAHVVATAWRSKVGYSPGTTAGPLDFL